jgi:hypothetical protein
MAIVNITGGDDACTQAVVVAGGVRAIVEALRAHGGTSVEVAQACCEALEMIIEGSSARAQVAADAGGVPAVTEALRAHVTAVGGDLNWGARALAAMAAAAAGRQT